MSAEREGFIYWVQAGPTGPVKIGFSTTPLRRLRSLQTACPFPLDLLIAYRSTLADEARQHAQLARFRMSGEWFAYDGPIKMMADAMRAVDLPHTSLRRLRAEVQS